MQKCLITVCCSNQLFWLSGCSRTFSHTGTTSQPHTHLVASSKIYLGAKVVVWSFKMPLQAHGVHVWAMCWVFFFFLQPGLSGPLQHCGSRSVQASPCVAHMFPLAQWISLCVEQHLSEQLLYLPSLQTLTCFTSPPARREASLRRSENRMRTQVGAEGE